MPIISLQRQLRELGRIRIGIQVETRGGKMAPSKLETFRLTSASRELIDAAAAEYGGTVEAWGDQWEVVTESAVLDIIIPPGGSFSQWFELWKAGGCERRCDGVTEQLSDVPCLCSPEPDERECKPTTRLNVILPKLPDVGVWRLETGGYYAAVELAGMADLLAASRGMIRARLRLDQRSVKRQGQTVRRFAVPVIELPSTTAAELFGTLSDREFVGLPPGAEVIAPVERPALPGEEPTGLTRVAFKAWLDASGIDLDHAMKVAAETFPDTKGLISDEQRALLRDRLASEPSDADALIEQEVLF